MKKISAIFLFALYLFSATELKQLIKLPLLVQHFQEHKAENPSLTLLQFLRIHYNDTIAIDADYAKDMQLPFKSHDDCYSINLTGTTATSFPSAIEKPICTVIKEHIILNDNFSNTVFLASIWQPPRTFTA